VSFKVYIPARFDSTRLPGKLLESVGNWPLIRYAYERATQSSADQVVIATDDKRIASVSQQFGARVSITAEQHDSGTDRIYEAVCKLKECEDTIIVNVQADEPLISSRVIDQVAEELSVSDADIVTACEPLSRVEDLEDENVVKVVRDDMLNALYFSRSSIPFNRERTGDLQSALSAYKRHVGIYAYRVSYLKTFVVAPKSDYERLEQLEQLRGLSRGDIIRVVDVIEPCGIGIDTPEELQRFRLMVSTQ